MTTIPTDPGDLDLTHLESIAPVAHVCGACARDIRRGTPWATVDDGDDGLTVWAVADTIPECYSADPCDWCGSTAAPDDDMRRVAYAISREYPEKVAR